MPGAVFRTKLAVGGVSTDVLTLSRPATNIVGTGSARFYLPFHFIVQQVRAALGTAGTGTALIADLKYNGVSILDASKVQIPVSANVGTAVVPASPSLVAGGFLTLDVTAAGTGAANLVVSVLGFWSAV